MCMLYPEAPRHLSDMAHYKGVGGCRYVEVGRVLWICISGASCERGNRQPSLRPKAAGFVADGDVLPTRKEIIVIYLFIYLPHQDLVLHVYGMRPSAFAIGIKTMDQFCNILFASIMLGRPYISFEGNWLHIHAVSFWSSLCDI